MNNYGQAFHAIATKNIFENKSDTLFSRYRSLIVSISFMMVMRDAMRWCLTTTISNHMAENEKLRNIFPLRFPPLIIVIVTLMWWNRPNESWIKSQKKKKNNTETVENRGKRNNSTQTVVLKLSCVCCSYSFKWKPDTLCEEGKTLIVFFAFIFFTSFCLHHLCDSIRNAIEVEKII